MTMESNERIITFSNTHQAISAEGILLAAGFSVKVMPMPSEIAAGCGICLRVAPEECDAALDALVKSGEGFEGVYC